MRVLSSQELFHIQEKLQLDLNESAKAQRHSNERVLDLERRIEMLQTTIHELRETVGFLRHGPPVQLTPLVPRSAKPIVTTTSKSLRWTTRISSSN